MKISDTIRQWGKVVTGPKTSPDTGIVYTLYRYDGELYTIAEDDGFITIGCEVGIQSAVRDWK